MRELERERRERERERSWGIGSERGRKELHFEEGTSIMVAAVDIRQSDETSMGVGEWNSPLTVV